ncbi:protein croquemort-like [Neocloeon triangulifer]|uniref:protein croquemort-like n=1 Tax=Neocloeon triangulifer TaxID=2078957 RepID=UPI00286F4BD1|nr:protein croquemort-like [Neocloeon triangulifer]
MPNIAKCSVFVGGTTLVTLGGFMLVLWPSIHDLVLKNELTLTPSSIQYNVWEETPIPIYMTFYLFNWTNPEEILNKNVKPRFTEHGPYVFREHHKRVNISWKDNNDTVEFHQIRTYFFEAEMSNGSLDDLITTVDPVALSAAYVVRQSPVLLDGLNLVMRVAKTKREITKRVGEFLFEGYNDTLLNLVNDIHNPAFNIPFDKFGWFYARNNSWKYDGKFDMYTGKDDIFKVGVLTEWNDSNMTTDNFGTCAMVNGTTGELWPPIRDTDDKDLFTTDLCRPMRMEYSGKVTRQGIEGNYYTVGQKTLDNGQNFPENKCFCGGPDEAESCLPAGAMNVSRCKFGAPAFVSLPHFYKADPYYLESIDMPAPSEDKDQCYIVIEPTSGIPMDVEARLQVNLLMQPYKEIKIFKDVPRLLIPMFHFNQNARLTPHLATLLSIALDLKFIGYIVAVVLMLIGLAIFTTGIYMTIWGRWGKVPKPADRVNLIVEENDSASESNPSS